jgi:hypothetical protein
MDHCLFGSLYLPPGPGHEQDNEIDEADNVTRKTPRPSPRPDTGDSKDRGNIEENTSESTDDYAGILVLSSRQKAALAAASYLTACFSILVLISPIVLESWERILPPGLDINTTLWDRLPFHLAFYDDRVYPNGSANPRLSIPRDVASITHQLYQESRQVVEDRGIIARQVILSLGKIETGRGDMLPAGDEHLVFIGADTAYIEMFDDVSPGIQLAECPHCHGEGCEECGGTGRWGRYPAEGSNEIVLPEQYITEYNLSLVYDQDSEGWVGETITAFYDLQGAAKTGEYTLYLGPGHIPPREGIEASIVGVIRGPESIISLDAAWALKGFSQKQPSSFLYIRIPDPRDYQRILGDLSKQREQYDIFILAPHTSTKDDSGTTLTKGG